MELPVRDVGYVIVSPLMVDTVRKVQLIVKAWATEWSIRAGGAAGSAETASMDAYEWVSIRDNLNKAVHWRLRAGMFQSTEGCMCDAKELFSCGSACGSCMAVLGGRADKTFITLKFFEGVYPFGRSHWWTGWTVAVTALGMWQSHCFRKCKDGGYGDCYECQDALRMEEEGSV
jgi:hypothetical protein